ncbi:anti-sigma factor [Dictyobacter kobayashii]|uniref:Uncharacterized protein n=1 Tax=Dictyobacter kobayashii TaxID=2014872 RepID=A0A402AWQ2_9CHLR|nr:anti-sigma factor [Dictyobacter kobayashii]GCE23506.1 hypothetical protein KDK_73060 [Dictyobacter kobayashii]
MKKNDSGDFSVLYVEPTDEKTTLFPVIAGQKKPVVLMLAEQAQAFQRPDDFTTLKHIKRQYSLTIVFVIAHSAQMAQLASRNGFPVYQSMEDLVQAVSAGQLSRQRSLARPTIPLETKAGVEITSRNTAPLRAKEQPIGPGLAPDFSSMPENQRPIGSSTAPDFYTKTEHQQSIGSSPAPGFHAMHETAMKVQMQQAQKQSVSQPLPHIKPKQRRSRRLPTVLAVITMALILAIIGSFLFFSQSFQSLASQPAALVDIGRLTFVSSGQVNESSSQGIADQVILDAHNLPDPAPGKKYYAWLLGDKNQSDPTSVGLGALTINNGNTHLFYAGDAQHSNLLLITSRVLITEEDATMPPLSPSVDMHSWRYYGEFSSTPIKAADNINNYSYLDHLRHLLASDPTLEELELPGGLNNWLYNNTGKLVEWTTSMRETWQDTKDSGFIRRQTLRVLAYLDGTTFLNKDLPPKSPLLVDERLARIGLINVAGPNQQPPSYLDHINHHLSGLLQADSSSATLRKQINDLTTAISNINFWLGQVRQNAQQIVKLNDKQLLQPMTLTLINNMIDNTNHAFAGQLDPSTNQMREGVIWLHDHMQALATINLTAVKPDASGLVPQIVPGNMHPRAFVLNGAKR